MSEERDRLAEEWAKKQVKEYTVSGDWMCLVSKPEAIKHNTTFLSDHETKSICSCEFMDTTNYAFRAGYDAGVESERKKAAWLIEALKDMCGILQDNNHCETCVEMAGEVLAACQAQESEGNE